MDAERLRIETLNLRIPGLTEAEARQLGREVVQRIAEGLPAQARALRLGALDLRVTVPGGMPRDHLAERIAMAILERLA
jgi:hypothetical protein